MSIQAYQRAATQADSPRQLEYRAFGQVTAELVKLKENPSTSAVARVEALEANRKLWHVLGSDCSIPDNKLPLELRAQIISLAMWVARYTRDVLREGAEIDPLIDINRSMMEGLASR
jgi:flagellar biosynthesis activator protein FlaF